MPERTAEKKERCPPGTANSLSKKEAGTSADAIARCSEGPRVLWAASEIM
jgi:hypothetical protein